MPSLCGSLFDTLKVDSNKKLGSRKGASNSALLWHCGDRGLFSIWTCWFSVKLLISVSACNSDVLSFLTIGPLCLFKMWTFTKPLLLAELYFISWIGEADQICRINIQTNENLSIFAGGFSWHSLLAEHFVPLCLLVKMSPVNWAVVSVNGNMYFKQKLHVHMAKNHRLPQSQTKTQSYRHLSDPPHFSLLSTF